MIPYIFLFALPACAALAEHPHSRREHPGAMWIVAGVALTLMIGLRYQVGGDWNNYFLPLMEASYLPLSDALTLDDPGYMLLNWLAASGDLGMWFVNLICGALFTYGLLSFSRQQPRPWLAIVVAVPYLIT